MDYKKCTQCKQKKELDDFYICRNKNRAVYKSECKRCTIRRNAKYFAKKNKPKTNRAGDPKYRAYQREYYARNQEKFKEYRQRFNVTHPDYFNKRYRRLKKEQRDAQLARTERDVA